MILRRATILLLALTMLTVPPSVHAKPNGGPGPVDGNAGRLVLAYAQALATSDMRRWAAMDLGCLTRGGRGSRNQPAADEATSCWNETLKAHTAMVAQEAEAGVFDAIGRGAGFGLLHDRHRAAENWKDYPPAVFLSPPIVRRDRGPAPDIAVVKVHPLQSVALIRLVGNDPVSVKGQAVDVKVVYRDPLTAPLALRPEEVWWVTGAQRRFGPVREVQVRFILLSDLRKYGYAIDRAVMNEAFPDAPLIATTHYGLRPGNGRQFDDERSERLLKGQLLPGTARWWERQEAETQFQEALTRAAHMTSGERSGLLTRLLLLDPSDPHANAMRGDDAYRDFLRQGVAKGGLAARDEEDVWRLAELYWTLQAQTWRQELTAVAEGYEPAADTLYRASAAYDQLVQREAATPEQQRRLGTLSRWNNDPSAALAIHERLLANTPRESPLYGRLLTDIAWDRLQWVSWERRYDHPWLRQAATEAQQAAAATSPRDQLSAHYALVVVESLAVPRDPRAFETALNRSKESLAKIPGNKGMLGHLVANDLVKGLTPEAPTVVLPSPPRSTEVLDVAVHANVPKQDIVWQWNFDQDQIMSLPAGFTPLTQGSAEAPDWSVQADGTAPTTGRHVVQARPCSSSDCAHLLVADPLQTTYPDVAVQVQDLTVDGGGEAGVALAVLDHRNYYAVTLQPSTGLVTTRRVVDGVTTVLGQAPVRLTSRPWHTIRVQRINFIHVDKGRLSVFIDGAQVAAVDDALLPREGRVGLITIGRTTARFDSLHVLDLVSNRPLSKPAAY